MKNVTCFLLGLFILFSLAGCSSKQQVRSGFLSDYSNLELVSDNVYMYLAPEYGQGKYSKVIVDPVVAYFHEESKALAEQKEGKIKPEELQELMDYAREAIIREIGNDYPVVSAPGPDVIRLRIAITDLMRSKIGQNIVPHTKVAGTGLGGASMEGEMLDSMTGRQLAAIVQTQKGTRWAINNATTWGDAKNVIDAWAKRFRQRLDESRTMK